jgi:hypothetical protein
MNKQPRYKHVDFIALEPLPPSKRYWVEMALTIAFFVFAIVYGAYRVHLWLCYAS